MWVGGGGDVLLSFKMFEISVQFNKVDILSRKNVYFPWNSMK